MNGKSKIISLLFFLLLSVASCEKENTGLNLQANNWKVEKIRKKYQSNYAYPDSTYMIRFTSDSQFEFTLDTNRCTGRYEISDKGRFILHGMHCTRICCDSKFATDFKLLFTRMTEFYGIKGKLHFEGESAGEIVLEPVE